MTSTYVNSIFQKLHFVPSALSPQVSHAIIDGLILTERWKVNFGDDWYAKKATEETKRVHPASIARVSDTHMKLLRL